MGWFVLDSLVPSERWVRGDGPYLRADLSIEGAECILIKPLSFVNLSGEAAVSVCNRYALSIGDLLVVLDDVHLHVGDLRLRKGGSDGGHNGLASIEASLGSRDVPRLRIGIGSPGGPDSLVNHVLTAFDPAEEQPIGEAVADAARIVTAFGRAGYPEAAELYSRWKSALASKKLAESETAEQGGQGRAEDPEI